MLAPLIGITARRVPLATLMAVPLGMADAQLEGAFSGYGDSVSAAGGIPMIIGRKASVDLLVPRLDGLLLSGGEDVEPHHYGGSNNSTDFQHDHDRDIFELALISAALTARLPILAICRGVQILNVALGGTLVEHLDDANGFSHASTDEHRSVLRHGVTIDPGSELAQAVAANVRPDGSIAVNSFHHQAILDPGRGLRVVAHADDGTIEGVEIPGRSVIGVQWHPEMHAGTDPIFKWFIDAAQHMKRSQK